MSAKDLKQRGETGAYILVDLDRTLAHYSSWAENGREIGPPIPAMVERIQRWLHTGAEVRIFTARASREDPEELEIIQTWCQKHVGKVLPIQNWKCFKCIAIWDDLAITVEPNTGWRLTCGVGDKIDPLDKEEERRLFDASRARKLELENKKSKT